YDTLIVERQGPVGWLINNRPEALNAMTAHMRDEFADAWIELDKDPDVRVIVHTGNGRAFQTGVDVQEIASDGQGMQRYREIVDPPERLRERAQELGETIAKNSPAAMAATKKALWAALEYGLTEACRVGAQHLAGLWGHPDQDEGPRAFAEKREPNWAPYP